MLSKLLRTGLFTATLAVAPSYLVAQEAAPAPEQAATAAAPTEAQQIQARLGQIQQQAMTDPGVKAAFDEINTALEAADPEFKQLSERARSLKLDVDVARAANDNARLHELAAEAKNLQTALPAARARATQNPAVQEKVTAFRTTLAAKMQELEPETQNLIARLTELSQ